MFPIGFVGYPSLDPFAKTIREYLDQSIDRMLFERVNIFDPKYQNKKRAAHNSEGKQIKKCKTSEMSRSISVSSGEVSSVESISSSSQKPLPDGYPIIVYPFLDPNVWKEAGRLYEGKPWEVNIPQELRKDFYNEVKEVVNLMKSAGVCHLDIRLSNMFYRVTSDRKIEIKLIDFDFAHPINSVLNPVFYSYVNTRTENEYPKEVDTVDNNWNLHMLGKLYTALSI